MLNIPESEGILLASWGSLPLGKRLRAGRPIDESQGGLLLKEARLQTPVLTNRNGIPRPTEVDK